MLHFVQVNVRLALCLSVTLWAASASAQPIVTSHSQVYTFQDDAGAFTDFQPIPGAGSELSRTEDLVCGSIDSHNLPKGAYTFWWVIFNNPENCANPAPFGGGLCSEPDLFVESVNGSLLWGGAGIVGPDSVGHFSACLQPGVENAPGLVLFGPSLTNPFGAEVHVGLKWHGDAQYGDADMLLSQLTTLGGTEPPCDAENLPLICPDPQFAVHPAGVPARGDCNGDGEYDARDIHRIDCG